MLMFLLGVLVMSVSAFFGWAVLSVDDLKWYGWVLLGPVSAIFAAVCYLSGAFIRLKRRLCVRSLLVDDANNTYFVPYYAVDVYMDMKGWKFPSSRSIDGVLPIHLQRIWDDMKENIKLWDKKLLCGSSTPSCRYVPRKFWKRWKGRVYMVPHKEAKALCKKYLEHDKEED